MDDRRRIVKIETRAADGGSAGSTPAPRQRFQLWNRLDSAAVEVDEDTAFITYEEYHPYGSTSWWASNGSTDVSQKRYRYTGKERDEETGLAYHGARYYAAWLGRWDRVDPAGMVDGPNRWAYCRGNPVSGTDPTGMGTDELVSTELTTDTFTEGVPSIPSAEQAAALAATMKLAETLPTPPPQGSLEVTATVPEGATDEERRQAIAAAIDEKKALEAAASTYYASGEAKEVAAGIYLDAAGAVSFGGAFRVDPLPPEDTGTSILLPHRLPVGKMKKSAPEGGRLIGFLHSHPTHDEPVQATAGDVIAAARLAAAGGIGVAGTFNQPYPGSGDLRTQLDFITVKDKRTGRQILRDEKRGTLESMTTDQLVARYGLGHTTMQFSLLPSIQQPTKRFP